MNGSTLVIGHGFPTSSFEWREMIPRLIPHFARVVVFDYVGFGLSDKPVLDAGVYSVADHADTLLFVLEMTRSKDLELLCHDMSDSVCSEALSRGLKGELLWLRIWVACVCVCFFFCLCVFSFPFPSSPSYVFEWWNAVQTRKFEAQSADFAQSSWQLVLKASD